MADLLDFDYVKVETDGEPIGSVASKTQADAGSESLLVDFEPKSEKDFAGGDAARNSAPIASANTDLLSAQDTDDTGDALINSEPHLGATHLGLDTDNMNMEASNPEVASNLFETADANASDEDVEIDSDSTPTEREAPAVSSSVNHEEPAPSAEKPPVAAQSKYAAVEEPTSPVEDVDESEPDSTPLLEEATSTGIDEVQPSAEVGERSGDESPVTEAPKVATAPSPEVERVFSPPATVASPIAASADSTTAPVEDGRSNVLSKGSRGSSSSSSSGRAWLKELDPRVHHILLWRDPRKTGPILGSLMLLLLSLNTCSVFSVVSYLMLLTLIGAMATRVYKYVIVRVHAGDDVHPFKCVFDADLAISEQKAEEFAQTTVQHVNCTVSVLRDLILVKDFIQSFKFGIVLYAGTYIGAWFNGMTVIILLVVGAFTLPKFYEVNERQINETVEFIDSKYQDAYKKVQDKIPFLKQKTQ